VSQVPPPQADVTRDEYLARVRADRALFDRIVDRVPRQRLEEDGLGTEDWSVKDVLWHIAWGDRQNVGVLRAKALVGSDLWKLSDDERNAAEVKEGRERSLEDVLREYKESYAEFIEEVGRLSDDDLNDATRWTGFTDAVPGWKPWRVLYDPDHYEEHGRWIEERLAARR
jgi:uncharacterized damage-inducible protein DinB